MQTLKLPVLFLGMMVLPALSLFSVAQSSAGAKTAVHWMTLEEAGKRLQNEKRPVIIDLYTDWCGWCKVMDKRTYTHEKLGEYLDRYFYAVKINAEAKPPLAWGGKEYTFNERYRAHNFALFLTRGNLSYPTTVIIPADGSPPQAIPGYLKPADFELVARYFAEDGKTPFMEYRKNFKPSW